MKIVVAGHSTLSGGSIGILTTGVPDAQGFLHHMLQPAVNGPRLGRHLYLGETAALKEVNTIIAKQSYCNVGQLKKSLRKDTDCLTTDYLGLEESPGTSVLDKGDLGAHNTYGVDSGLSRSQEWGGMGAVTLLATTARTFIATSAAAPDLPALQTPSSALDARLISSGAMGVAFAYTATTSFVAPTTTSVVPTPTATATPVMLATTTAAGGERLAPAPGKSKRAHHRPCGTSPIRETFHRLADRVRHLQDQHGHQAASLQQVARE